MSATPLVTYFCEADFYAFWSAAQQFFAGRNPYLVSEYPAYLQAGQCEKVFPLAIMNPPWGLPLLFPFAFKNLLSALLTYLVSSLISLILIGRCSMEIVRTDKPVSVPVLAWAPLITFGPVFVCLGLGQISIFITLFFSIFLYLFHRRHYFASGFVLSLTLMKPHLLYLLYFFIILQALRTRPLRLTLIGLVAGAAMLSLISVWILPDAFAQYQFALQTQYKSGWMTPTIGSLVRNLFPNITMAWIVPVFLGLVLTFLDFRHRREIRIEQLMTFALISLLTTPYLWSYDFALLLPFAWILLAAGSSSVLRPGQYLKIALVLFCNIALVSLYFHRISDVLFLWVFLLLWIVRERGEGEQIRSSGLA